MASRVVAPVPVLGARGARAAARRCGALSPSRTARRHAYPDAAASRTARCSHPPIHARGGAPWLSRSCLPCRCAQARRICRRLHAGPLVNAGIRRHLQGEAFSGRFPGFVTRMSFDPKQLATAKLDVAIPLATATTANADYDGEMRGKDFFAASRYPPRALHRDTIPRAGWQPLCRRGRAVVARDQQAGHAGIYLDAGRATGAGRQGDGPAPGFRHRKRRMGRYQPDPERDRGEHESDPATGATAHPGSGSMTFLPGKPALQGCCIERPSELASNRCVP